MHFSAPQPARDDQSGEIEYLEVERRQPSELEQRISRLKEGEALTLSAGSYGLNHPSVQQGHATITYDPHRNGARGSYLIQDGVNGVPSQSGVRYFDQSGIWERINQNLLLESGMSVRIGEYEFTLPANIHTTLPFALLRAPTVRLGETIGIQCDPPGAMRGDTLYGEFAAYTSIGAGARTRNEDGFLKLAIPDGRTILCSIDGMGGHGGGDVACRRIAEAVSYICGSGHALKDGLDFAPYWLEEKFADLKMEAYHDMGACVAGVEVTSDAATFVHAGDVKGLLLRPLQDGMLAIVHETIDHSYVQELVIQGILTQAEAFKHPQRNIIHSALSLSDGRATTSTITTSPAIALKSGDLIILYSDGVGDNLEPAHIVEIAESCGTPSEIVQKIHDVVHDAVRHQNGKDDNISLVVYRHLYD